MPFNLIKANGFDLTDTYNFTAMPQKGSTDIISKGSNSNGYYVKFADGTLICNVDKSTSAQNQGASAGNFYYSTAGTWTYPLAFNAAPRVIAQVSGGHYNAISAKAFSINATTTNYITQSINSTSNAQGLSLLAIGTWA
jgi:hypothetical protein|tara:strand:+ start:1644 stop:2060 length:417 start_codon:yes stop_codon:yes gene_type:complete